MTIELSSVSGYDQGRLLTTQNVNGKKCGRKSTALDSPGDVLTLWSIFYMANSFFRVRESCTRYSLYFGAWWPTLTTSKVFFSPRQGNLQGPDWAIFCSFFANSFNPQLTLKDICHHCINLDQILNTNFNPCKSLFDFLLFPLILPQFIYRKKKFRLSFCFHYHFPPFVNIHLIWKCHSSAIW